MFQWILAVETTILRITDYTPMDTNEILHAQQKATANTLLNRTATHSRTLAALLTPNLAPPTSKLYFLAETLLKALQAPKQDTHKSLSLCWLFHFPTLLLVYNVTNKSALPPIWHKLVQCKKFNACVLLEAVMRRQAETLQFPIPEIMHRIANKIIKMDWLVARNSDLLGGFTLWDFPFLNPEERKAVRDLTQEWTDNHGSSTNPTTAETRIAMQEGKLVPV